MWLVKNGIPFDLAFSLDDLTRTGWSIILSEMEGNKFDFNSMKWVEDR